MHWTRQFFFLPLCNMFRPTVYVHASTRHVSRWIQVWVRNVSHKPGTHCMATVEFDKVKVNEVDRLALAPYTWKQSRRRQAVEFTLLPICCQNRQHSWTYTRQQSTLLPISWTDDFQQSRPRWIQLCCSVAGYTRIFYFSKDIRT